jgi:hypothetical protein
MQPAEAAHLVEAGRQDMLKEAADEFVGVEVQVLTTAGVAVPVLPAQTAVGEQGHLGGGEDDREFELRGGANQLDFGRPALAEGFLPEELDRADRLGGAGPGEAAFGLEVEEVLAKFLRGDLVGGLGEVFGQVANAGQVTDLGPRLEGQQTQVLGKAVQDCVGDGVFLCIGTVVDVLAWRPVRLEAAGRPNPALGTGRSTMQKTVLRDPGRPIALLEAGRLHRRVAASFNKSVERAAAPRRSFMSRRFYRVIGFGDSPLPAAVAHVWRSAVTAALGQEAFG